MGSRVRENPENLFEVFAEIARPTDPSQDPFVLQKFPEEYDNNEILNSIPKFAFPCGADSSFIYSSAVDHFTFVQTDLESKFKFGFCRHGMGANTCLCIVSSLPWYEIFYKLLNQLAEILNRSGNNHVGLLLSSIYEHEVAPPGAEVDIITDNQQERFTFLVPDPLRLPRIPDNRNLTEYYNAVDQSNMMILFAAMLYERRVLITSKKLSRLTACIHGASALLYPMHWQHLYIPVLPHHLLDYCSAPMPFLIGVHSSLIDAVNTKQELGDAVILNADTNTVTSPYDDLASLPPDIVSQMKKKLKALQSDKMKGLIGDGVARVFLKTLVSLIGGYRDALKFRSGEQITFDPEAFINSRPSSMQPFLESMLHLQIFEQFINDRLDILNAGLGFTDEFEVEANMLADKTGSQSKYRDWLGTAKRQGKKLRSEGKDRWVQFTSKVKDKSRKAYKDIRSKMDKKDEELGPGLNRNRPTTLPSPTLRAQRPRRPPLPNIQSPLATDDMDSQLLRRASYEKRSRQYKVLTIDDTNGEDGAGVGSGHQRLSSEDDEITYNPVSVGLLNDADIISVYKKSYSLEDLSRITSPTIPDIEEAEDALLVDNHLGGYHSLVTVPSSPFKFDSTTSSDRSSSSTPTIVFRQQNQTSTPISSQHSSDRDSPGLIPRPAPRMRNSKRSRGNLLIKLEESKEVHSSSDSSASLADQSDQEEKTYQKFVNEFDPLANNQNALASDDNRKHWVDTTKPDSLGLEDNNNDSMLQPRNRNSIYRVNAFYNIQRPPAVKKRISPTPGTLDTQSLKEARTAFMSCEVQQPMPAAVSLTGLDQFDPLLTGQLAVDAPPQQLTGASSRSSGSSVDTGISAGSRTQSSETMSMGPNIEEDNLLKEWNLDFSKMRIGANASKPQSQSQSHLQPQAQPPPVPPKPTLKAQSSLSRAFNTSSAQGLPALGARSSVPAFVGKGAGTVLHIAQMYNKPQPQSIPMPHVVGSTSPVPAACVGQLPSPSRNNPTPMNSPHARLLPATSPVKNLLPARGTNSQTRPTSTAPPLLHPKPKSTMPSASSMAVDPFGTLEQLLSPNSPSTLSQPSSFIKSPQPKPRNSWQTFD